MPYECAVYRIINNEVKRSEYNTDAKKVKDIKALDGICFNEQL